MSYFRKIEHAKQSLDRITKEQKWLILINADPDAMASSMALKRILRHRGAMVDIARVNELSRPDNLAMIRYTRIHMLPFKRSMLKNYTHFAIVDSQPSHHPDFADIPFSIIIDHHPVSTAEETAPLQDIRPEYGATSTMLTEYLYNLDLRPGVLLATALQFGIRTDTMAFQRNTSEVDIRAYLYLGKLADAALLQRIMSREFHLDWLPYFAKGINCLKKAGKGYFVFMGKVESPDILVLIADFLTRVYEVRWVAVGGVHDQTVVLTFRSDGAAQDVGRRASFSFGELGSAGGHKTMARAEFPISKIENPKELEAFIHKKLMVKLPAESDSKTQASPAAVDEKS